MHVPAHVYNIPHALTTLLNPDFFSVQIDPFESVADIVLRTGAVKLDTNYINTYDWPDPLNYYSKSIEATKENVRNAGLGINYWHAGDKNTGYYCGITNVNCGDGFRGDYDSQFPTATLSISPLEKSFLEKQLNEAVKHAGMFLLAVDRLLTQNISVSLTANPSTGSAPLNSVDLQATVTGSALGTINYTFYCDRSDSRTNITTPNNFKIDGRNQDGTGGIVINQGLASNYSGGMTFTVQDVCKYNTPGTYTAKVIAERGAVSDEARVTINVGSGTLYVATNPVNGEIFINGTSKSAGSWSGFLPVGNYTVTFGPVSGYTTPLSQSITIISGQTTSITGIYRKGQTQLPQTGQTTCYNESGQVIACNNTGQDGDIRAGVAWPNPRFTDNGDGTMTDNLTGLIWVKDGNLMRTRDPSFDTDSDSYFDDVAGDGQVTWQHALDYIKKLNQENYLGHNDWRLPNVNEFESLGNTEQKNTATWLSNLGFVNTPSVVYWSSTSLAGDADRTWVVTVWYGGVSYDWKTHRYYVWPVRAGQGGTVSLPQTGQKTCWNQLGNVVNCSGTGQDGDLQKGSPWPNPRFTDNGDQTITDNLTGLIWTKDATAPSPAGCGPGTTTITWKDSFDYVKCLNTNNYLGHTDWRLPNRRELKSLLNYSQSSSNFMGSWLNSQGFNNVMGYYYCSSSSVADNPRFVWEIEMSYGYVTLESKDTAFYIWPVRVGQSASFYNLVISKSGSGIGTATSATSGINCGSQCTATYGSGTLLTLAASADPGSTFVGWSGGGCSGINACTGTLNANTQITARFVLKGDIDNDGTVTLPDAIMALQIMSGKILVQTVYKESNVNNNDNKFGLEDLIYILQKVAGIR